MARGMRSFLALCLVLTAVPALAGPAATDTSYFDGFTDLTGLDPFRSLDVELDALGGVRLKGNAPSEAGTWTTQADFSTSVFFKPALFIDDPLIPIPTLDSTNGTYPDSLVLPYSSLAFRRTQVGPVLSPSAPASVDGYSVSGMSVVRVNLDYVYYMYYTGFPEDGQNGRLYLAKSNDCLNWPVRGIPVLELGEPGTFDSRQLGKPSVIYDPLGTPKFKMWYSAEGNLYGSIGYATSEDGVLWSKYVAPIVVLDSEDDVGTYASMVLGTDGLPLIVYYDATNGDLKAVHCGNDTCTSGNTILVLDYEGDVGRYARVAVGGDGLPVISYYDATNGDLKVLHCGTPACTVGNTATTVDGAADPLDNDPPETDVGAWTDITPGLEGYPLISYYDATNGDLKLLACNDPACAGGDEFPLALDGLSPDGGITPGADVGLHTSVALVVANPLNPATSTVPAVSYYDATNGDLRFLACNDPACSGGDELAVTLDGTDGADVGRYTSLDVGLDGFPVMSYFDATNADLKVAACNDALCLGGDETVSVVDAGDLTGEYSSLVIGPDGLPYIAYPGNGDLMLVHCNDAACAGDDEVPELIDGTPEDYLGTDTALIILPDGLPLIAYYDGTNADLKVAPAERQPQEVLGPGIIGSIDSYTVSHPSVLYENGIYRMWYTANDSNLRRIAYAVSSDGISWNRGGKVIDVGNTGNDADGAWAPTVFKVSTDPANTDYHIIYTAWKNVAGSMRVDAKLYNAHSTDGGITWVTGNVAYSGGNIQQGDFDGSNCAQAHVLFDPGDAIYPYKMWYVGNSYDANYNFHDRIGYARGNDPSHYARLDGPAEGKSVLGLGEQSDAFDSMFAADLAIVPDPLGGGNLCGFYAGTNAVDFQPRIGVKQSADGGLTWTDIPAAPVPLVNVGAPGGFDDAGVARPAPVDLSAQSMWAVYHTSLASPTAPSIGLHTVSHDFQTVTTLGQLIAGGTDPAALLSADGLSIRLFYAVSEGTNPDGSTRWGLRSAAYDSASLTTQTAAPAALVFQADPTCWDLNGDTACDNFIEDTNGNGICEAAEDLNGNGACEPAEDVNGDGLCVLVDEDANHDGLAVCAPIEDTNGNGICEAAEDLNGNGACEPAEDVNADNFCVLADEDSAGDGLEVCDAVIEDMNLDGICDTTDCDVTDYDSSGMRHPLVLRDDGAWRLWYTAIGSDGIERIAYAESVDEGATWVRGGLAADRSTIPYDFAEKGIRPASVRKDELGVYRLAVTGVDRFGWRRSGLMAATGPGYLDGGTATYQYPDDATLDAPGYLPRDWRQIIWNPPLPPEGTGLEVWVSYYPTYSGMWSNFFKIDDGVKLPFQLSVLGMRWQLRLTGKSGDVAVAPDVVATTPQLYDMTVDNADIAFPASGTAVTIPVGPPLGKFLLNWGELTVRSDQSGGTLWLAVEDQEGTPLIAPQAVSDGEWSDNGALAALPATTGNLILVFTFTPNNTPIPPETPLLQSVEVTYASTNVPAYIILAANPPTVLPGEPVTVTGILESRVMNPDGTASDVPLPLAGQAIVLKTRAASQAEWTTLDPPVLTDEFGGFSFPGTFNPVEDTYFRAEFAGSVIDPITYPPAVGSVLVEMKPATLLLNALANPILFGKETTLVGSLAADATPLPGQNVALRSRPLDGVDFTELVTLTTAADGTFSYGPVAPTESTVYQVQWGETVTDLVLGIKPKVALTLSNYASRVGRYKRYPLGRTVAAAGKVTPNHRRLGDGITAGTVTVTVYRRKLVDGVYVWNQIKQVTRSLTATSTYAWSWRPRARGFYRIQTSFAGDTDHAPNLSKLRYVEVY